jgi:tripartite-type tricarboxylate transporter receptor subunit TctC
VPDLPTSAEAGLPGMELQVFNGLFVRSGTPAPIISKYSAAAEQVKQKSEISATAWPTLVKEINFRAG